ncbi:hypothetical protein [Dyella silvatica]|uniref:hypothetical protein n=1 Tax=Dyella silvatica TaxID=2992128 RepID=UPI00225AD2BA|nr:hypothetical protein [Dyella silvatica]
MTGARLRLLALLIVLIGLCLVWRIGRQPDRPATQGVSPTAVLPQALAAPLPLDIDAGDMLPPATRDRIAEAMLSHDDFVRDVSFLLVSSIRSRCEPLHAHDLTRMVMQARLPVLLGASTVLIEQPELRPKLYGLLRHLAAMAPCGRSLHIAIGKYRMRLDPSGYAAAFPDSYFDPASDEVPSEFAGRDLHARSDDPCTPIGYAVLPLGVERAWQCGRLRADARRHLVVDTCAAVLQRSPGPAASVLQSAVVQQEMALAIHNQLERLPVSCR